MKKINFCFIILMVLGVYSMAQIPEAFNYQAVARDGAGNILQNQSLTVIMGVYSGAGGATLEYEETHSVATSDYGVFTAKIGTGTVNFGDFGAITWGDDTYFLKVEIDDGGGFVNLGKTQMISVPYAMHAKTVEQSIWQTNGPDIFYIDGAVGIGTNDPVYKMHVHSTSGPSYLIVTDNTTGLNDGLRVGTNGTGNGYLLNDYDNGNLYLGAGGTYDMTLSPDGLLGIGALPQVKMHSFSEESPGVFGSDLGVQYSTSQYLAPAIYGRSVASTGDVTYGVLGNAYSNDASYSMGVFGEGGGAIGNNYGIYAVDFGETGSNYSIAVYGDQNGTADAGTYAGYFSGDVSVTGTLSKGGGSFKIDHPDDPANKYLYHSFVESPDMMNIYNGNVTTDAGGLAKVTLPDYFQSVNKDFRYQLTVIGTFAEAIIAKEIEGNHFTIQTDKPNVKVSWMVTGVRKDPWANENRIIPVVEKKGVEKGKYLHPGLYSKSKAYELPTGVKASPSD